LDLGRGTVGHAARLAGLALLECVAHVAQALRRGALGLAHGGRHTPRLELARAFLERLTLGSELVVGGLEGALFGATSARLLGDAVALFGQLLLALLQLSHLGPSLVELGVARGKARV